MESGSPPLTISFFTSGDPVPQGSMRIFNGRVSHDSGKRLNEWRDAIAWNAKIAMAGAPAAADEPVAVVVEFVLARGRTVTREQPHVKPDVDKLARAVLDALEGVAYANDSQVVSLRVDKRYAFRDAAVGATVAVSAYSRSR